MITINTAHQMDILKENFRMSNEDISFKEWVNRESENDPKFFNWLFGNADNIDDFGIGMTDEQCMEAAEFFGYVGAESNYLSILKKEEEPL